MKIVFIDDEIDFVNSWKEKLVKNGDTALCYSHFSDFISYIYDNEEELQTIGMIIVDRFAKEFDAIECAFPVEFLKLFPRYEGKFVLCSGSVKEVTAGECGFHLMIPKTYKSPSKLLKFMK